MQLKFFDILVDGTNEFLLRKIRQQQQQQDAANNYDDHDTYPSC